MQSDFYGAASEKDQEYDFYHWSAILRSVSGFEVYRKVYRDVIKPERVAELLILRPDMPRSLHASLNEVVNNLRPGGQRPGQRDPAPRRQAARRAAVRPHRRDSGHRPACLPDAVSGSGQRPGCPHQPRFPGTVTQRADGVAGGADQLRNLRVRHLGMVAQDPRDTIGLVLTLRHRGVTRALGAGHFDRSLVHPQRIGCVGLTLFDLALRQLLSVLESLRLKEAP